ncbi:hypothetical protein ACFOUP_13955 [Belliella kenyensis]|uniref:SIMPL domain-containing protein n=1 Tax=Belliella kenyensis TaxID=1472724 RepID=A0ABV8EQG2_9BACT|nr:hypothetical protein [Belliella kenyensis]MCH7401547.1 hypothetical protein [Belliella kenyensis]MDN3603173.1 hypothetical protein [Belliella kenyensis]
MKISFLTLFSLVVIGLALNTSCNPSTKVSETIEMTGFAELELPELPYAINVSFNGIDKQKVEMQALVANGELSKFKPKLLYENLYQDGDGVSSKGFTHSISYMLILQQKAELDEVVKVLTKHKLPGYVNTMGSYIEEEKRSEIADKLFQAAMKHAENRIAKFADSKQKSFSIIEVSDADEAYANPVPHDGVAYQNKLVKKVKLKAILY